MNNYYGRRGKPRSRKREIRQLPLLDWTWLMRFVQRPGSAERRD
jgi:hypothetical protein